MLAKKEKVFMKGIKIFLKRKKNKNMVINYTEISWKIKRKKREYGRERNINLSFNEIKALVEYESIIKYGKRNRFTNKDRLMSWWLIILVIDYFDSQLYRNFFLPVNFFPWFFLDWMFEKRFRDFYFKRKNFSFILGEFRKAFIK